MNSKIAIIIPLQDEEACIGEVLDELLREISNDTIVAVGLNGCTDATESICASREVVLGKTDVSGYGHGCYAAIEAVDESGETVDAFLFYAGDGANRPSDARQIIELYRRAPHYRFIMGIRAFRLQSWLAEFGRALPNLLLGVFTRLLGGQFFHDLGPLRLIERKLFETMELNEMTWGWTIEAQIRAAQLGVPILSIPVEERPRIAGDQKVSGVSLRRSLRIGWAIAGAGWRTSRT